MSLSEEVELLRSMSLFQNVEPSKLKLLAFTSERLTFAAEQQIVSQGDMGDAAYIVVSGEAKVIIDTPDGPLVVATLKKSAVVGEIAILCDVPRTASVVAATELETLKITKDLFFRLITEFPTMAVEIMRDLAVRLHHTNQQLAEVNRKLSEPDED